MSKQQKQIIFGVWLAFIMSLFVAVSPLHASENETVPRDKYYLDDYTMNAVVVREWTPLSNSQYSCVFITHGYAGGVDCFKKENTND